MKEIAEIYDRAGDKQNAEIFYRQAADLFQGEEQKSEATKCLLNVAQYAAEAERYGEAVQIYEDVARQVCEGAGVGIRQRVPLFVSPAAGVPGDAHAS